MKKVINKITDHIISKLYNPAKVATEVAMESFIKRAIDLAKTLLVSVIPFEKLGGDKISFAVLTLITFFVVTKLKGKLQTDPKIDDEDRKQYIAMLDDNKDRFLPGWDKKISDRTSKQTGKITDIRNMGDVINLNYMNNPYSFNANEFDFISEGTTPPTAEEVIAAIKNNNYEIFTDNYKYDNQYRIDLTLNIIIGDGNVIYKLAKGYINKSFGECSRVNRYIVTEENGEIISIKAIK